MRGLMLQDLPLEIIANIASYMPKETCRRYNQVARASVFSWLSFYSETPGDAYRAIQNLRKDTWQEVKDVKLRFLLSFDSESAYDEHEDCDWQKPSDVWRDVFLMLSNLNNFEVELCFDEDIEDIEDILDTAFCRDTFASLCLPATHSCHRPPSLQLHIQDLYDVSSCSPVWLKLWQAFSDYRQITIDIARWLGTSTIPDDPFMLKAAGLSASGSLRALHLYANHENHFRLAARIPSITSLRVSCDGLASSRVAWACIRELAPGLVELSFEGIDDFPVDQSQSAFALPLLEVLELSYPNHFAHLQAQLRLVDMPALQSVSLRKAMSLDCYCTSDAKEPVSPRTQAGFQKAINDLKSIVRFDTYLPPGCRSREYTLQILSNSCSLRYCAQKLSGLLSAKHLNLTLTVVDQHSPSITASEFQTGETTATIYDSQKSPLLILLEPFQDVVTYLVLKLNQKSAKCLMTPRPVKFARLKVLRLQKYDTAIEWNDVSTLFSNVVLPVLKALDIPSDSSDFNQQCATLQDWLPTWPLLEELTLTRPHQGFRADASQELQKLQGACKNRSPPVSFDYPH